MRYVVGLALLVAVVALLWTPDSGDAIRFRRSIRIRVRRVRVRRIVEPICRAYCHMKCTLPGVCAPVCKRICSIGKKRRAANACLTGGSPFPGDFDEYDKSRDLQIDISEFAETLRTSEEEARDAFLVADRDQDGVISEEEFESAPFCFDGGIEAAGEVQTTNEDSDSLDSPRVIDSQLQ